MTLVLDIIFLKPEVALKETELILHAINLLFIYLEGLAF